MTKADQELEDEVLRRMLNTKPKPHRPLGPERTGRPPRKRDK